MRHAIGGTAARELREQDLLNDVLNEVTSMHEWSFLDRGEAHVDLRGPVGLSGWSWTASTKTLFDPLAANTLAAYSFVPTDLVEVTAGGTTGFYPVASKPAGDDSLVLSESIFATDLAGTVGGALIARAHLLPADFRSLIEAGFEDETSHLRMASPATVGAAQRYDLLRGYSYVGAVEWVTEAQAALRLSPTPSASAKSAIAIVYKRRLALVGADGQDIDAPEFLHRLIKDVARALVRGLEMPETYGEFSDQLARIKIGAVFQDAVQADGGSQVDLGRIANGHIRQPYDDEIDGTFTTMVAGGPVSP
jgi:hypothetical protein